MPGKDDAVDHKGQLPPFTPPKFHLNQDKLYEQLKASNMLLSFPSRVSTRKVPKVSSVVQS